MQKDIPEKKLATKIQKESRSVEEQLDEVIFLLKSSSRFSIKSIMRGFVIGLATALGATFGLTIFLAVIGYVLKVLGAFPGIGNWFISLGNHLHK